MAEESRMRRWEKAAARRAAFHAARWRSARTAEERLRAASDHLRSAVAHASRRETTRKEVYADVAQLVRAVMAELSEGGLSAASRQLHERQLMRGDVGVALMCLVSVLRKLPEAGRELQIDHYAAELSREATEIAARR